jgi:hypothetical protein
MSGDKKLRLSCPECQADLVVDVETGQVLFHEKAAEPLAGGATLESLMDDMKAQKTRVEGLFEKEKLALQDRDRLLEEKFREAMDRASESDDNEAPPLRHFDLE